jgi:alkanesulfonate monooxygenase SsuD/methylene tetrahydromethanopterin reductase-like flavin-dependent oxidoreductase (luciferase family)
LTHTGRAPDRVGLNEITMARSIEFGLSLVPEWADAGKALWLTSLADELGYDLVGIQDHPYQWRFLDTWTLIAWLAGHTSRVRFFPDVASLPMRPPAVLAKSAASLDVLTGGRVELGLGAGAFWEAIVAMGGDRRSPGEAVQATEEAIDVIRLIWSGERGRRYDGKFYRLAGVNTGPTPAHPIGIWVGAYGPRMLDLIGRKADGWVPSLRPGVTTDGLARASRIIEDSASKAGRDPDSIRRVLNVGGVVAPARGEGMAGPPEFWVEELSRLAAIGIDAFVFWPAEDDERQVELFAAEVIPGVREATGGTHPPA